jgi:signal transduction histidine kinase/ligand-binding sensor domain-containing protein
MDKISNNTYTGYPAFNISFRQLKKWTPYCLLSLLISYIPFWGTAQTTNLSFTSPLRFTNYTIAEGLPSNNVNDMMQDSRGFLWFSTGRGLARFDGSHFVIYNHSSKDSGTMPFDNVVKCTELNNHELLFLSNRKLWTLNPVNGRQQPPSVFWQKKGVSDFFLLKENLLAITIDAKTYLTNLNLDIIDSLNTPVPNIDKIIYLGNNNILFENAYQAFAYSLTDKKMVEWRLTHIGNEQNRVYFFDDADTVNKRIYLRGAGYQATEMCYDIASPDYLKPLPIKHTFPNADNNIFYNNGVVIISREQGLDILQADRPEMVVQSITGNTNSILPSPQYHIYTDNTGNYWSTSEAGISRFSLQQLNYQFWKLPYPATTRRFAKYDNKIWMADERYGSYSMDCSTQTFHVIDSSILQYCWGAAPVNNQIYIHGTSVTWFHPPYLSKLLIYDPQTKKISNPSFLDSFTKDKELITLVYQSRNGDVWYSINGGGGLVRQQPGTNKFTQYAESNNTPSFHFRYLNKAAEDNDGNVYFSVNKKSDILVWKNAAQHFEEWKLDSIVPVKDIHWGPLYCHIIDGKQNLWLSYEQAGLVKYNLGTRKAKFYTAEDGLPSNVFDNMAADADGNIWFPTPKGLCCLLAATDKFIIFTERDGLPFTDFSNSSLFFDSADSSIYFSGKAYLYKINSNTLLARKKQSNVKIFIEGMDVNNHPYYFDSNENISLQPDENNLQFTFTLLDLDNKISNKNYEYLLKRNNENANWQSLQGTNTIAFSRLKPGIYTFSVRMQDESGNGYINGSDVFHFTIAIVWYNTAWFIFLCICVAGLIAWAFMRLYYQRKLARQKAIIERQTAISSERSRIAADMHDDMGAGLSRMRYLSTAMKNEIKDEALKEDFDKLITGSDELVDKMNEIIWTLNSSNETLEDTIYYIRSQCSEMLDHANIAFEYNLPVSIPGKIISSEEKRNLYLVVKEAVHNAIKHSNATQVNLSVQINDKLIISVTDNGIGFDAAENKLKGNGLSNYQKRMAVLKGSIAIQSGEKGTTITFDIPLV